MMMRPALFFLLSFCIFGLVNLSSAQAPKSPASKKPAAKELEAKEPAPKEPKQPDVKWPRAILGKSLETWVALMYESKDASERDQAIRTLPLFGPKSA